MLLIGAGMLAALQRLLGLRPALVAGMFAGSFTNTPALAGVLDYIRGYVPTAASEQLLSEPIVGYSAAYPIGVIGPMLIKKCLALRIASASPLGWMPRYEDLDWRGMESFTPEQFHALMAIDREVWIGEIQSHDELFTKLYDRLPKELIFTRELILSSLWRSPEHWEI